VRSLYLACAIACIVVVAYAFGLPYGPSGVALGFSIAMSLWCIPHVFWCLHKTAISPRHLFSGMWRPLAAVLLASIPTLIVHNHLGDVESPLLRLTTDAFVMGFSYSAILIFALGQKDFYMDLLRSSLPGRPTAFRDGDLPVA
jgi:hypothetical protein